MKKRKKKAKIHAKLHVHGMADGHKVQHHHLHSKICLVGIGRWGKNHAQALFDLGLLGGIVETAPKRAKEIGKLFPQTPIFTSLSAAFAENFDGFVVATPAHTHFEIGKEILSRKKHVLIEKPLALNSRDARELVRLAEKNKVRLMTGHVLLFHPAIRKIKKLIEDGKIGKLEYLYSNRLNLGTVRQEENALWSFAPHDISIFQYFVGAEPIYVSANGGAFLQPHIHDVTMTCLSYPQNIIAHIFVSWLHPFKEHRLVLIGSKGMLTFEDSSDEKHILFYEKGIDWKKGEPVKRDGPTEIVPYEKAQPLTEELRYFDGQIHGDDGQLASGKSAVEVLEILERASLQLEIPGSRDNLLKPTFSKNDDVYIHETAMVDFPCQIGKGTKIWHFSHIMKDSAIGQNCNLGQNTFVASHVKIGNNVKIQNNVSVYTGVEIEDDVFMGPSCVFTNVINPRSEINRQTEYQRTLLKRGATVGANATLICGHTIGRFAFIAAGAVVTKDVPDYALMMGTPAKRVGWMSRHGVRLPAPKADGVMTCPESGLRYKETRQGTLKCLDLNETRPIQTKKKRK